MSKRTKTTSEQTETTAAAVVDEQQPSRFMQEEAPEVRMFVPVDDVIPWPGLNPRTHFDPAEQAELEASVRQKGVKQPGLVHLRDEGPHWLIIGERRWRACASAGRMFPAVVGHFTEEEAFELALVENIQRADLTPIEEGRGFRRWLEQHPGENEYTLAERINKSQPYISMRLNLLRLPENIQSLVAEGLVTGTQARDAFLPFANIPEEPREQLFAAVHDAIRAHFAKEDAERLNLTALKAIVGNAAFKLSKPLTHADADVTEERPLFDASDHDKKCKCNGPAWLYRNWGNPQRRCFRPEWWSKKQEAARKAQQKEQEERAAEAQRRREEADAAAQDESAAPIKGEDARRIYANAVPLSDSTSDFRRLRLLVDPALIPANALRIVEGFDSGTTYTLICTDREAMQRAEQNARDARAALIDRLTAERLSAEKAEAPKLDLRKPDVIAELLTTLPKVTDSFVARVAREHGLESIPAGPEITRENWLALDPKDLTLFARILVLRIRAQGEARQSDQIDQEANRQLREAYEASLAMIRPALQLPRPAYAERLDEAVTRFFAAHNPLAAQVREAGLAESAGEAIHALAGIVEEIRAIRNEALAAGEDPATLTIEDVEERFTALEAAYQSQHGPQAEQDTGAPEGAPAPAVEDAPAPAAEEAATAPAEEQPADDKPAPAEDSDDPADELASARKRTRARK